MEDQKDSALKVTEALLPGAGAEPATSDFWDSHPSRGGAAAEAALLGLKSEGRPFTSLGPGGPTKPRLLGTSAPRPGGGDLYSLIIGGGARGK